MNYLRFSQTNYRDFLGLARAPQKKETAFSLGDRQK